MKKRTLLNLIFAALVALIVLGANHAPVSAGGHRHKGGGGGPRIRTATEITLVKLDPVALGAPFILQGTLKDAFGRPIKNRSVLFTLNGQFLGQARTDAYGMYERKFVHQLDAGNYSVAAYWKGMPGMQPAATVEMLHVQPAVITVQTVPVIAGVPFTMNSQRVVTDENGVATFTIQRAGEYPLNALVEQYHNPTEQIKFGRWLEESYDPTSLIKVPTNKVIQVGFDVFRLVGQSFVDLDGYPVDPNRISEFMIRSAQGDVFIFHDGQPRWIPSSRVARRVTGLEETKLLYSVISVTVDGSNVVNSSQQRFFTFPTDNWPISLLLYSLKIESRDGLFGFPVGRSVNVTFPNGEVKNYPLGKDGTLVIHSLARGTYYTEMVGIYGMGTRTPVALSRNQDVNNNVLTYLDLSVVGMLGLALALGLLIYGRPSLVGIHGRARQPQPIPVVASAPAGPDSDWGLSAVTAGAAQAGIVDYRSLRYENVRSFDDDHFVRAIGMEREQFEQILSFLLREQSKSGRQTKLSSADQLLLTIIYFREHPTRLEIAPAFGISAGTVGRTIERVKQALVGSEEFNRLAGHLFQPAAAMLPAAAAAPANQEG